MFGLVQRGWDQSVHLPVLFIDYVVAVLVLAFGSESDVQWGHESSHLTPLLIFLEMLDAYYQYLLLLVWL